MRCLVTGGSGYFGSLLVRRLLSEGHECAVLDVSEAHDRPPETEFFKTDIRNYDAVRAACQGRSVVFHNVAQVPLARDRRAFFSVNAEGTGVLLRACAAVGVEKVVYTSSSAIYGAPECNPVTEDTIPHPAEPYGAAKLQGERICADYCKKGLNVTIIRPRTILGHGRLGIFQILFEWVREGRNIPVLGTGNNRYQFVHADDLAQACLLSALQRRPSSYNCGTDRFGTMRETLQALCTHAATGSKVKSVPRIPAVWAMKLSSAVHLSPLAAYHWLMYGREMYFDISRARRELGWQPCYSNCEMICESYDWYLANRETLGEVAASRHRSAMDQRVLRALNWFI